MRLALASMGLMVLCGCAPWTIRPIQSADNRPFSAPAFADSIWSSKLLPELERKAVDLATFHPQQAGAYAVRGSAHVLKAEAGAVGVDVAPYDGRADAYLQTGPVILGSALRDAAGFLDFSQFVNQLQYADVANELNARALKTVIEPAHLDRAKGKTVSFTGACAFEPGQPIRIVAVRLNVEAAK